MVELYAKLVKAGKKEIGDVPEGLREEVRALLDAEGGE